MDLNTMLKFSAQLNAQLTKLLVRNIHTNLHYKERMEHNDKMNK